MSTKIEWTEKTWNPFVGCTKVSAGCKNCYAERHSYRLSTMPTTRELYGDVVSKKDGGDPRFTGVVKFAGEKTLLKPLSWRKPSMVFVNSMSDLFHESIPFEEIDKVFAVMAACPQHTFQILTKRPERMKEYIKNLEIRRTSIAHYITGYVRQALLISKKLLNAYDAFEYHWPLPNVWLGVSVENQETANERIPHLLNTPAAVRFLSCEPLLGAINLNQFLWEEDVVESDIGYAIISETSCKPTDKLNWVIVGGESGKNSRPMHPDWARSLRDQCTDAGVAFFFKQLSENSLYLHCKPTQKGFHKNFDTFPDGLKTREYPVQKPAT